MFVFNRWDFSAGRTIELHQILQPIISFHCVFVAISHTLNSLETQSGGLSKHAGSRGESCLGLGRFSGGPVVYH